MIPAPVVNSHLVVDPATNNQALTSLDDNGLS